MKQDSFRFSLLLIFICLVPFSCKKAELETPLPAAVVEQSAVVGKIKPASVFSPADGPNLVSNLIDGNTATAWTGNNKNVYLPNPNSQYVLFNLGTQLQTVSYIKMAFNISTSPNIKYEFDVQVSPDGVTGWVTVGAGYHNGQNNASLQTFDFPDTKGRYVRVMGHGNNGSSPAVNSWTEVEIYGSAASAGSSIQLPLTGSNVSANNFVAPNVPANVLDGNLSTYWASKMSGTADYKNITVNLGAARTVDLIKLSMYTGGDPQRMSRFGVLVSSDSISWTKVIANTWSALDAYSNNKLEVFDFPDVTAKYVRVECYGHTGTYSPSAYNSINEIQVWGAPAANSPVRITSIVEHYEQVYATDRSGNFYYNANGDLDSVGFNGATLGNDEFTLWKYSYNTAHQLTGIMGRTNQQYYTQFSSTTTTYGWQNGRIVQANIEDVSYGTGYFTADSIVYDGQGRVSADYYTTRYEPDPEGHVYITRDTAFYTYDSRGNRIFPGQSVAYDNQVSFLRSDPVLMFQYRNYSQNNPLLTHICGYTAQGYPTGFCGGLVYLPFYFFDSKVISSFNYGPVR